MFVLGIDVGTTGTKALVIDEKGTVIAGGYKEYKLISDGVRVTQNAADWWDAAIFAVKEATKGVNKSEIVAISMSTQAASMFPADKNGDPIYEVITWMDSRSSDEAKIISDTLGAETVYRKTGWLPNAVLDAAKILWLKNHEPELIQKGIIGKEKNTAKLLARIEESKENDADSVSETQSQKETEDVSDEQFEKKYGVFYNRDASTNCYILVNSFLIILCQCFVKSAQRFDIFHIFGIMKTPTL